MQKISLGEGQHLVTMSKKMGAVVNDISRLSGVDATVLVWGETGTGKELVARAIHTQGPRKSKPFIAINCAAIPDNLLESELFGYEKGAFTDARKTHIGRIERTEGGTLLLDEIADMSLPLQAKLLRVLQDKKVERLGSAQSNFVDVRVICTTNVDLRERVKSKEFRQDLFWRISVDGIHVPPLRERRKDIPVLVSYFVERYARKFGIAPPGLSRCAMRSLQNHTWPGNVRELENTIHKALIDIQHIGSKRINKGNVLSEGSLFDDSPDEDRLIVEIPFGSSLEEVVRVYIYYAMDQFEGDHRKAAEVLDVEPEILHNRLQVWNHQEESL
jgi:DNA-binding NtrC family response regulator